MYGVHHYIRFSCVRASTLLVLRLFIERQFRVLESLSPYSFHPPRLLPGTTAPPTPAIPMEAPHGALVVFGSGPGVGLGIATLFAERGFAKVILMSRNAERLAQDAAFVRHAANDKTKVLEIPVDAADLAHVTRSLQQVDESLQDTPLECVLFNAARTGKSEFFEFPIESFEHDLKVGRQRLSHQDRWRRDLSFPTEFKSNHFPFLAKDRCLEPVRCRLMGVAETPHRHRH
nr:3-ketodihydrosphingosine reductase [Quercus suber]